MNDRSTGFVYFVATITGAFVKIGYTADIKSRMKAVQMDAMREFGCGVRVIGFFPGSCATEQWLQLQVSECRYKTDWFHFSPRVREFMKSLPLLPPDYRACQSLMRAMRECEQEDATPSRRYTLSPAAIEQRRNAGIARQDALGEDGRTEYARTRAAVRWAAQTPKKRKRRVVISRP